MLHKPYADWMQATLDGLLALPARRELEVHLAECPECQAAWAALSAVDRLLGDQPLVAPRPGFAGRFQARLAERRTRPRLVWGALALGLGAVGAAALVMPFGLGLVFTALRAAQQPATSLALASSLSATASLAATILDALLIAAQALVRGAVASPWTWAASIAALALTGAWVYVMRRVVPEGRTG